MTVNKTHEYHCCYGTVTISFWHDPSVCEVILPAANRISVNRIVTTGSLNFKHTPKGWQCLERETYLYRLDNGKPSSEAVKRHLRETFLKLLQEDLTLRNLRVKALEAHIQDCEAQIETLVDQANAHRAVIKDLKQQTADLSGMTTKPQKGQSKQQRQQH